MRRLVLAAICLVLLVSCATGKTMSQDVEEMLNPQIGKLTYDKAVMAWGIPDRERNTDNGVIAEWYKTTNTNSVGTIVPVGAVRVVNMQPGGYTERLTIRFREGVMVNWSWEAR